jgi:hypothetical protein
MERRCAFCEELLSTIDIVCHNVGNGYAHASLVKWDLQRRIGICTTHGILNYMSVSHVTPAYLSTHTLSELLDSR